MKKILAAILLLSLALRLAIAAQPIPVLLQKIVLDDSFYGLETGKNIASGILSHNGFQITNGVQPLWPLMVSQFFNFTNGVSAALLISVLLDTLTAALVYKIARKFLAEKVSLAAAALYGLNPIIAFTTMSGIDVILAAFLVAAIFYSWSNRKNPAIVGVLLGFGLLARADILFLALPIIAIEFLKERKRAIAIFSIAALIFLPWLAWSFTNFGTLQQSSSVANYEHNHGIFEEPRPNYSFSESLIRGVKNFAKFFAFAFHYFGAADYSAQSFVVGGIFILLAAIGFFNERKNLFVPLIFGFLILAFYSFYLWSFGPRYIAPLAGFISIAIASSANFISEKFVSKKLFPVAVLVFLAVFILAGMAVWERGYFPWQAAALDEVDWIKSNTQSEDVIGSFNSGIITFFSERKVINIDGIMSFPAIRAIENRSVYNYMKSEKIKYWVDLDFFPAETYDNQASFDISKENRWKNVLGQGAGNLKLVEQKFYRVKNLRGQNITIVRFAFELIG